VDKEARRITFLEAKLLLSNLLINDLLDMLDELATKDEKQKMLKEKVLQNYDVLFIALNDIRQK